jgi:hypothetical protein
VSLQWVIETWVEGWGWTRSTRAGPTRANAEATLAGYERDYPRERHRLVNADGGGE